jgi:hypothetical protein
MESAWRHHGGVVLRKSSSSKQYECYECLPKSSDVRVIRVIRVISVIRLLGFLVHIIVVCYRHGPAISVCEAVIAHFAGLHLPCGGVQRETER